MAFSSAINPWQAAKAPLPHVFSTFNFGASFLFATNYLKNKRRESVASFCRKNRGFYKIRQVCNYSNSVVFRERLLCR